MESKRSIELAEKRQLWEEHLSRWESGGLSQAEYCRRNNLRTHNLVYWKKKLRAKSSLVGLVEVPAEIVSFPGLTHQKSPLCLLVGTCYKIEITQGFDADTLERLIRVLNRS